MTGRFRRVDEIPQDRAAVVGPNIRVLRQKHGWNQAKLGELMGWPSNSWLGRLRLAPLGRLDLAPPDDCLAFA